MQRHSQNLVLMVLMFLMATLSLKAVALDTSFDTEMMPCQSMHQSDPDMQDMSHTDCEECSNMASCMDASCANAKPSSSFSGLFSPLLEPNVTSLTLTLRHVTEHSKSQSLAVAQRPPRS